MEISPISKTEMQEKIDHLTTRLSKTPNEGEENDSDITLELDYPSSIEKVAYHGIAGKFVQTISPESEADPVALLLGFLAGAGNIIGPTPHFFVDGVKHGMRIYPLLVGETAKGRKGVSWNHVERFLTSAVPEWKSHILSGLSSGEGLIWAAKESDPGDIKNRKDGATWGDIENKTAFIENPGRQLLIIESEFVTTLKRFQRQGNTLSPIIRQAWDSGNLQVLTKSQQMTNKNMVSNAHITIIGHITKRELLRNLQETETANGFANRFLYASVRRSQVLPFGGKSLSEEDLEPLIKIFQEVIKWCESVKEVDWHPDTKPLWANVYPELSTGKPGLIGAVTSRAEAYVTRLATLYALLDCKKEIFPKHLEAALAVWEYCEASARYIFQDSVGNPIAEEILHALHTKKEGMSRTELNNLFDRNKSSCTIKKALEDLEALDKVEKKKISTGGRPKEIFRLKKHLR